MRHMNYKKMIYPVAVFVLISIAGLWSWNTLSELFNGPQAQYKHILALAVALFIAKWITSSKGYFWKYCDPFRKDGSLEEGHREG